MVHVFTKIKQKKYTNIGPYFYPTGLNEETGSKFKVGLCDTANTAILLCLTVEVNMQKVKVQKAVGEQGN